MSESTEKVPVHVVVDKNGRQFVGRLKSKGETIELMNPLLMIERIQPTQVADKAEIFLNFSPVLNTFPVDYIELKWSSQFPADESLERAYEDFWTQIRAARSGLSMARSMPGPQPQGVIQN
jgi:hypothetical protein